MHYLFLILLAPILLIQGYIVRKKTPVLPEPDGAREGTIGTGPELRLLIIGDSAGAGVGAVNQHEALSGQVIQNLADTYTVSWRLSAVTGATTQSTIASLAALKGNHYDVALVSLGVNDVTSGMRLSSWRKQQHDFRTKLFTGHKVQHIICSGMPPIHGFPALSQPLRWFLGRRGTEFDEDLKRQLDNQHQCHYLNLRFSNDQSMMASDGFHPGPSVYKEWGKLAADRIKALLT